jgi:PAS domain S-box-containing protein
MSPTALSLPHTGRDFERTLGHICGVAVRTLEVPFAAAFTTGGELLAKSGPVAGADADVDALARLAAREACSTRAHVAIGDARHDPRAEAAGLPAAGGAVACLAAPVIEDGVVRGAVCVLDHEARGWTPEELVRVRELAGWIADEHELQSIAVSKGWKNPLSDRNRAVLRTLLDGAPEMVYVTDMGGGARYVNPAVHTQLGYSPEELLGQRGSAYVHPDDVLAAARAFHACLRGPGAHTTFEARLRHRDGSWRPCELTVRNPALPGEAPWLIVNLRDISADKAARAALETHQSYFEQLFENAPEGIVLLDTSDRVVRANREFLRMFGYTADEVRGRPVNQLIVPEARRGEAAAITARVTRQERVQVETVRRCSDGTHLHVSILGTPVHVDGRHIGIYGIYRDITERVRHEEERRRLLERERAARAVAEAAERRAAFLAEVGSLLDASLDYAETFRNLAHMAVPVLADYCLIDEIDERKGELRRVARAHVDPEHEHLLYAELSQPLAADPDEYHPTIHVARTGEAVLVPNATAEMLDRLAHDDAHRRIFDSLGLQSYLIVPLIARGRTLGTLTLASTRLSERRYGEADLAFAEQVAHRAALALDNARLYGEAQRAIQARERVLAFVSHDLRNPLATVLLNASMLLEQVAEGEDGPSGAGGLREQLGWIMRSSEQMNRLIQDLLEVTRIEAGRLRLERTALDVAVLLAEAGALFSALASEKEIALEIDVASAAALPPVWADRERLHQVLSNLIGNALKFTLRGGWVRLRAEAEAEGGDAGGVRFVVEDGGIGIEADQLPHLFDPYWQGRRGARGGVGLGLAIARGILEAHGGTLAVESTPGQGSTFSFTIPAVRHGASAPDAASALFEP